MIKQLFDYYLAHQDELVKEYNGKYLVITENGVEGALNSESDTDAYYFGKDHFGLGNFIVQLCTPGTGAYTTTSYSVRPCGRYEVERIHFAE